MNIKDQKHKPYFNFHGSARISVSPVVSQGGIQLERVPWHGAPVAGQPVDGDHPRDEGGLQLDSDIAQTGLACGAGVAVAAHVRDMPAEDEE